MAEMIRSVSDALVGEEFKDTTGLAEREEVNSSSVREHRVYHGSGADFDAFDHSHMGEGEGAQAYGWDTYVTEVDGIGKTYAIYQPHTIYHNTNYGKNEKPGKYTFFRTNETYSTCQHVAIATSKHQWFYNTSNWSGYICLVKKLEYKLSGISCLSAYAK